MVSDEFLDEVGESDLCMECFSEVAVDEGTRMTIEDLRAAVEAAKPCPFCGAKFEMADHSTFHLVEIKHKNWCWFNVGYSAMFAHHEGERIDVCRKLDEWQCRHVTEQAKEDADDIDRCVGIIEESESINYGTSANDALMELYDIADRLRGEA